MYYTHPMYRQGSNQQEQVNYLNREIRVAGEGILAVQPDQAEVSLGVSSEGMELQKVQQENGTAITKIIQAVQNEGVKAEDIQTIEYSIYPVYDFVNNVQTLRGYKVNHILNIPVTDIQNVGLVVDIAVSNGANTVSNISFSISNRAIVYQQALAMAVENAILKASTIAQKLQIRLITPPFQIIENTQGNGLPPSPYGDMVKSAATTPVSPGTLDVKAAITARFSFGL